MIRSHVLICGGTGCTSSGSLAVRERLAEELKAKGLDEEIKIVQTGCFGLCALGPVMIVYPEGTFYSRVTPEDIPEIVEEHLLKGRIVTRLEYKEGAEITEPGQNVSLNDTNFYKSQLRVALRNCGGAGFPTGLKWKFAKAYDNDQKYVCCNADEGDPGAFMDRSVLEGDPHVVLEAMTIAGYTIGASQGYIYVRAEYPIAVKRLQIAIDQAHEYGLLGDNILGTGFKFDIGLRLGAGAFVCGEETALMTSIEGNRGEPRPRPPFPAEKGLFQKPSILNNVETYANIPQIILKGADWFASMGTEKSKGTKVFALGGKIKHTGLVEIPMGTPLRKVIEEIGGGIPNGKKFKAAQTGGPSGGCIPAEHFDVPIDYDNLIAIGSMMGSGGLIVMDEDNCMVDIAKFFLQFTVDESCGKCTPCRIGTKRLLEMLTKITDGKGTLEDLDKMEELCHYIKANSLCGLGQTAPNPVLSTLHYFRDEYIAHVVDKRCPAGVCKNLLKFVVDQDKCIGCGLCMRNCPASAITRTDYVAPGHKLASVVIDTDKCVKCGVCLGNCKFKAISKK